MNILFLMTDQQRYDCIGYAANSKVATPNLDRLAEGTTFSQCQTVNPICQPARTALLTGRYSHQIGTLKMAGDLNFDLPTFPQALRKAGYWTAGIGKFHYLQTWPWSAREGEGVPLTDLKPEMEMLGYDHVWETSGKQLAVKNYCDYCETLNEAGVLEDYRAWVTERGANSNLPDLEQLENDGEVWPFDESLHVDLMTGRKIREAIDGRPRDKPFFILGSFCSPHKPFDPPQRFLDDVPYEEVDDFLPGEDGELSDAHKRTLWKLRRAYKATIRLVDEEVGKILDQLEAEGLLEETVIVFTSDHGEMMGDHFRVQKSSFYRESLNVPLAIRHPEHLRGAHVDGPVELTDITATLLDVAGLDPADSLSRDWPAFNNIIPSRSLLPVVRGEVQSVRDYAFAECQNQWQSVVSREFKYIRMLGYDDPDAGPEEKLFRIADDPGEQTNLAGDPAHAEPLDWHRRRVHYVMDHTPPCQHVWAPLIGG